MANENVVFRRGPSSSIPEQKVPGTILIETDTGNAFVDDTAENRVQLTDTRLTTRVDDVISQYGYIHNGVLTGDLNASSHSINNLPTPSANGDAANKQYVDTAFTTLESELGTTIAGYLPLKGGTMQGGINMAGQYVLNGLDTPVDDDQAAPKGYVDTEIESLSTSIDQQYLKLAGGTMTGGVSMGGSKITATYTPSDNADLTNKEYVDNQINEKIQASDAMIFKGTIGSTGATVTQLPTSGYKTGWTYRVITEGTYAGKVCEVGDMLIALNNGPGSGSAVIDADWTAVQGNIDGAVIAPDNLTSNQLVVGSNGEDEVKTLAAGANGQVLKVVDGTPTWSTHTGGSATQPIYLSSTGDPTPISYTIEANVPSDAKFTDTTYTAMQGASASSAGAAGLVPAPSAGQQGQYLRGDGTWAAPPAGVSSLTDLGVTATANELNYVSGVTSSIQTQLNNKYSKSEGILVPSPPGAGYILVSTASGCQWTQAFPYSVVIDDNATS